MQELLVGHYALSFRDTVSECWPRCERFVFRIGNGLCSFNHLGPSNHVTANNKVLHCVSLPKFARENILLQWMTEKIPTICGCECLSYLAHAKPMERQNSFIRLGFVCWCTAWHACHQTVKAFLEASLAFKITEGSLFANQLTHLSIHREITHVSPPFPPLQAICESVTMPSTTSGDVLSLHLRYNNNSRSNIFFLPPANVVTRYFPLQIQLREHSAIFFTCYYMFAKMRKTAGSISNSKHKSFASQLELLKQHPYNLQRDQRWQVRVSIHLGQCDILCSYYYSLALTWFQTELDFTFPYIDPLIVVYCCSFPLLPPCAFKF